MNDQPELFYDSYLEALRDDVKACGGPKTVGEWFWPDKLVETRRNMVNDRLNTERRDRFTDDQERLIMRRAKQARGFSSALCFICDDTEHERAKPKSAEDERTAAMREFTNAVNRLGPIADKLERLGVVVPIGQRTGTGG